MRQNKPAPASPDPATMSDECFADPQAVEATIADYTQNLINSAKGTSEAPVTIPSLEEILEIAALPALPMTKSVEGLRQLSATIAGFTISILAEVPPGLLRKAVGPMTGADIAAEAAFMRHCHEQGLRLRAEEKVRNN